MEAIIASGPVILEKGKLLVNRDENDDFYKLPGGKINAGETAEECCKREAMEEVNGDIEIIKPLSPLVLWKKPQTGEDISVVLLHYLAKLKNKDLKAGKGIVEIKWLDLKEIMSGKQNVGPNIKFLLKNGELK